MSTLETLATQALGTTLETDQTTLTAKLRTSDAQGTLLGEYLGQGQSKVRGRCISGVRSAMCLAFPPRWLCA